MDFSDVDLGKELSDSVFEVHEEVFDEDSLFKIHLKCDDILKMNDKARLDGVFKVSVIPLQSVSWSLIGTDFHFTSLVD